MRYLLLIYILMDTLIGYCQYIWTMDIPSAITKENLFVYPEGAEAMDDERGYDIHYLRCEFKIDPSELYIQGRIYIWFSTEKDLNHGFTLDLNDSLQVDSVFYHNEQANFSHSNHQLVIEIPKQNPSVLMSDSLVVYYQGIPAFGNKYGSFVQSDSMLLFDKETKVNSPVIWTLSEPYGAKDWWPCNQTLSDKIDSVDLYIYTPTGYRVASNGVLKAEIENGGGKCTHWKHRHPIEPYLLAIAIADYVCYSDFAVLDSGDSIEILNYIYRPDEEYARRKSPDVIPVMQLYSRLFGDYPFKNEKYGHAQFGWGGGMEHQTMSFMGNLHYELMAHELAHQWFGNYITCGTWADIWLNEGFATYLTGLSYEHLQNGKYWQPWLSIQIEKITKQANGSVYTFDDLSPSRLFNSRLSYSKGAMLLHTLRWEIGDSVFFRAMRNYIGDKNLVDAYAQSSDFIRHVIAAGANPDLVLNFFDDWLYGQGHPKYEVEWEQQVTGTVSLKLFQEPSHPSVGFFELKMPVLLKGESQDTLFVFEHKYSGEEFECYPGFKVQELVLDPDRWIVCEKKQGNSIKPIIFSKEYNVHPNPVKDVLYLSCETGFMGAEIKLFSSSGQLIIEKNANFEGNFLQISLKDQEPGTYLLRINKPGVSYRKMIVKL